MKALISIMAPVFFLVVISLHFHAFVLHAIKANLFINLGIIGTATFGVGVILLRLLEAQEDFIIIERFGFEAGQGVYMKTLLEEPWLKRRYVRHYLGHIAHTGGVMSSQMAQSGIESELHALQKDYESRLELPQFLVGFMIAMGLLGTFIGLLETLTGISGMLDGMGASGGAVEQQFMKLVVELRKPLAGMGIAFSASMFGLITSLMLAIMMIGLRRYISRVISVARNVMHDLIELTHEAPSSSTGRNLSPDEIESMFAGTLKPVKGGTAIDTYLAGRFDVLTKKIELLLEGFDANVANARHIADMQDILSRIHEVQQSAVQELRILSSHQIAEQGLLRDLNDRYIRTESVSTGTAADLNDIKGLLTKMCNNSSLIDHIGARVSAQNALLESIADTTSEIQQLIGGVVDQQKE